MTRLNFKRTFAFNADFHVKRNKIIRNLHIES